MLLSQVRKKLNISDELHEKASSIVMHNSSLVVLLFVKLLKACGYSIEEFKKLHKDENGQRECVVCYDAPATHIILDCMHICLCGE